MKRFGKLSGVLALVVVASLLLATGVFAETPPTLYTAIQVMNLSDTGDAHISLAYYNPNGTAASAGISDTLTPNQFKSYDASQNVPSDLASNWRGSVVISSDQPVGAIVNMANSDSGTYVSESYRGFPSADTANTMTLPFIVKNIADKGLTFYTQFAIQNAGSSATSGTVTFTPMGAGSPVSEPFGPLQPGAHVVFEQKTDAALGSSFIGSAKVVATTGGPIAVTAMQQGEKTGTGRTLQNYTGFSTGSDKVMSPLLLKGVPNAGYIYSTAIQVMNIHATDPVTARIQYYPAGGGAAINGPNVVIAAGALYSFDQSQDPGISNGFVGAGEVVRVSGASSSLVGIVSQAGTSGGVYTRAFSFPGFGSNDAGQTWKCPLVLKKISDPPNTWSTAIQVMDVSGANNNVRITYYPSGGGASTTFSKVVGANQLWSADPLQTGASGLDSKTTFIGSAVVESLSSADFVCYVGMAAVNKGDAALAYVPFK
jgi:hypothetical protein